MSFIVDFSKCSKRSLSNTCSFLLSSIHTWLVPIITTSFFRLFHYLRFHLKFIIRISWVGAWLSVLSELRWWTLCVTKRILRESPLSTQCWVRKRRGAGARSTRDDGGPRARFTAGETHTHKHSEINLSMPLLVRPWKNFKFDLMTHKLWTTENRQ